MFASLLGVVEGLTEFLPVSSTAHIRLTQLLVRGPAVMDDPFWALFAVAIQGPAIVAVLFYFAPRIVAFVRDFLKGGFSPSRLVRDPMVLVMVAFLFTVVPAVLAKKIIKANLSDLRVISASLLIGGIVMWAIDVIWGKKEKRGLLPTNSMQRMNIFQAAWIGLVQTLAAIFPGTSRSMATIAAGQSAGLTRATALEFSFFLSIPTMFAAVIKDLKDSQSPTDEAYLGHALTGHQWAIIATGSVFSFFVSLAVIAWFMSWVRKHGFVPFAIYRIIVGSGVLLWALQHRA